MNTDEAKLTRSFTITYDLLKDRVDYQNPDNMTYIEILGLIKYCEMMMSVDVLKKEQE